MLRHFILSVQTLEQVLVLASGLQRLEFGHVAESLPLEAVSLLPSRASEGHPELTEPQLHL